MKKRKQTTRMLRCRCSRCETIWRMSRRRIETANPLTCPSGDCPGHGKDIEVTQAKKRGR